MKLQKFSFITILVLCALQVSQPAFAASAVACSSTPENVPETVNMQIVRDTWLKWVNDARLKNGLKPYVINTQLNRTAVIWSESAKKKGKIDHKRPGQKAYYDYKIITSWFAKLGLQFKNVHGSTFVENVNWDYYKCGSQDCTNTLTKAIRHGFDFFMSEKGKKYRPHYESIMNTYYKEIGIGIAIDKTKNKYYLTVHYGTAITSKPLPVCGA